MRCSALFLSLALAAAAAPPAHAADFDGDGRDDLLQRHLHSDAWQYYTLVDDVPELHALAIESEPVWRYVATGDFDGNGYDDVLMRRYDTLESAYHAVTADGVEFRQIRLTVNPLYDVLGAGDLDGDGADEILIRRNESFGAWLYYDVDGTRVTLRRNFGASQNLDFEFAGVGDLDGDGTDDILARHRDRGHWIAYLMRGTQRATLRRPRMTQNLLFELQAFADITGDGKADPLLRNVNTGEWIYYATGNRVGGGQAFSMRLQRDLGMPREGDWQFAAIGDYDGDGRATPMLRAPLTGEWRLHDIEGNASDEVHFPGLATETAWAAVDTLPQDNPAAFSRIEFLQGPPTFRKDFRTGEVIGPINASRPENGEDPVPEWRRIVGLNGPQAWAAENQGFVTSIWGREMVVAVEATHTYRAPAPQIAVELLAEGGSVLPLAVLDDVTEPLGRGYRTELVFDLPRERNVPGGTVVARVDSDGGVLEEQQELFGETVEPVRVTWIPISSENFAAPELDPEAYFSTIRAVWPIAAYETQLGPVMRYERTGNEEDGAVFDALGEGGLHDQVIHHHAVHGCGRAEDYYAIYAKAAMNDAGVPSNGILIGGTVMIGTDFLPEMFDVPRHEQTQYPHEAGHQWRVSHSPCGRAAGPDPRYPYQNAGLGPARSWSLDGGFFVGPNDGYSDVMSYCRPQLASDFSYQVMLLYFQSTLRVEEVAQWEACSALPPGSPTSLAVSGVIRHDGSVGVTGTSPSILPPTAVPPTTQAEYWLTLEVADTRFHREPLVPIEASPHRPQTRGVWSTRLPAPPASRAATLSVESSDGAVLATESLQHVR